MPYTSVSATPGSILTDPIGNLSSFAKALKHVGTSQPAKLILLKVLTAFVLLTTFTFVGERFLQVANLSPLSLQIGGGALFS
jgi:small neutral amino acid transporter SnatA (MarC family)